MIRKSYKTGTQVFPDIHNLLDWGGGIISAWILTYALYTGEISTSLKYMLYMVYMYMHCILLLFCLDKTSSLKCPHQLVFLLADPIWYILFLANEVVMLYILFAKNKIYHIGHNF